MQPPLIGIDIVDTRRLAQRLERRPALAGELFHPGEQAYAATQPHPTENLAARFAAKEAVSKALGLVGFEPLDVEVLDGGDHCSVTLHGGAAERARELGVDVTISLTHLSSLTAAVALARALDER